MKKDIVVNFLEQCDLTCEVEKEGNEYTICGYNDDLQFEVYVIVDETKKGIEISSPLSPELEVVTDEVKEMVESFYEKNQTMVDLVIQNEFYAVLDSEDCEEKDIEFYLTDFMQFFAEEQYIDEINLIIDQLIKDNNLE